MQIDVIRHQHEKVGSAVQALMSLTAPATMRVRRAISELALAFESAVPEWAAPQMAAVRSVIGAGGDLEARVEGLDAQALDQLTTALFELYTVACREYWTA
jgi:hypothetical protein